MQPPEAMAAPSTSDTSVTLRNSSEAAAIAARDAAAALSAAAVAAGGGGGHGSGSASAAQAAEMCDDAGAPGMDVSPNGQDNRAWPPLDAPSPKRFKPLGDGAPSDDAGGNQAASGAPAPFGQAGGEGGAGAGAGGGGGDVPPGGGEVGGDEDGDEGPAVLLLGENEVFDPRP